MYVRAFMMVFFGKLTVVMLFLLLVGCSVKVRSCITEEEGLANAKRYAAPVQSGTACRNSAVVVQ